MRAILLNPRYTGHEFWNKQRKEERLLDVDDVTLGHRTHMTHNPSDEWIHSDEPAHEAIISRDLFDAARTVHTQRARNQGRQERAGKRGARPYAPRGRVRCSLCGRESLGDIAQRIQTATAEKKGPLYQALGITISYEHTMRTATVRSRPSSPYRQRFCPRGDLNSPLGHQPISSLTWGNVPLEPSSRPCRLVILTCCFCPFLAAVGHALVTCPTGPVPGSWTPTSFAEGAVHPRSGGCSGRFISNQ
ncbi:recombinase family protein [Streptomyces sp. NPDC004752]